MPTKHQTVKCGHRASTENLLRIRQRTLRTARAAWTVASIIEQVSQKLYTSQQEIRQHDASDRKAARKAAKNICNSSRDESKTAHVSYTAGKDSVAFLNKSCVLVIFHLSL